MLGAFAAAQINLGPTNPQVKGQLGATFGGTAQGAGAWAKGKMLCGTGTDTTGLLAVGTDGWIVVADSAQTCGFKWAAAPATGLADPGSNGILKRTALNATAVVTSTDILGLWTGTCNSSTYLRGDGACTTPGGGTPGGSNTQVQFNDSSAFGGDSQFTYNKATHVLTVGSTAAQGYVKMYDSGGTNSVTLKAPSSVSSSYVWLLPAADSPGFLKSDGAGNISIQSGGTVTSSGPPVSGNIARFTTSTNIAPAAAADIVALFSTCSGTQYLGADGGCHTAGGGSLVLIESHSASNSASLDLTACFTSTYDEYEIHLLNIVPASNTILQFIVSTNGGSTWDTTTGHYAWSFNYASAGGQGGVGNNSTTAMLLRDVNTTFATGGSLKGVYKLYNPLSATFLKSMTGQSTFEDANFTVLNWAGWFRQQTAFNALRLVAQSGNITSGDIRCYGVAH